MGNLDKLYTSLESLDLAIIDSFYKAEISQVERLLKNRKECLDNIQNELDQVDENTKLDFEHFEEMNLKASNRQKEIKSILEKITKDFKDHIMNFRTRIDKPTPYSKRKSTTTKRIKV